MITLAAAYLVVGVCFGLATFIIGEDCGPCELFACLTLWPVLLLTLIFVRIIEPTR